jgi:hypothetical protein
LIGWSTAGRCWNAPAPGAFWSRRGRAGAGSQDRAADVPVVEQLWRARSGAHAVWTGGCGTWARRRKVAPSPASAVCASGHSGWFQRALAVFPLDLHHACDFASSRVSRAFTAQARVLGAARTSAAPCRGSAAWPQAETASRADPLPDRLSDTALPGEIAADLLAMRRGIVLGDQLGAVLGGEGCDEPDAPPGRLPAPPTWPGIGPDRQALGLSCCWSRTWLLLRPTRWKPGGSRVSHTSLIGRGIWT